MIYRHHRFFRLLFILLFFTICSFAQPKNDKLIINGTVRVDNGNPSGAIVSILNIATKSIEKTATVGSTGEFVLDLSFFSEYRMTVTKENHYTKDIDVSTMVPSKVWEKDSIFPPFRMVVTIYKKVPNVTLSFEGKVVGKIAYSPKGKLDNFDSNIFIDDKEIRKEIDQAIKEHEDEFFNQKMAEAVEFEKKNQIREAIKAYEEALALRKNDQFIKPKLKELTSDLENMEKDALLEADFNRMLVLGDENVAKLKYPEAVDNFKAALAIKPGNQIASDKLINAEKLLAAVNAEKAKIDAEFNRLLAAGDVNVAEQKYPDAIGNFKGALAIKIGDKIATAKLANAEQLLAKVNADKAKLEAQANAEKARLEAEFNRLLAAGDANVADQKYPDAIENFKGALAIKVGDKIATDKLANAEKLLAQLNADKAKLEAQANAEKARLEAEFNRLLAAGDANVADQKYPDAIGNFKGALAIKIGDKIATDKLANAEKLLAQLNADKAKQEAEFNRLLASGDVNVNVQKYSDAIENFKGALAIKVGDKIATDKLANAEQLLAKVNADKAKLEAQANAEKARLEAEFNRLLAAGDANVADQKYPDAIGNFKGALAIKIGDKIATDKLANAEKLLAQLNADKAKQEAEFNRLLAAGDVNVNVQKYPDAIENFKGALAIMVGDKIATDKLANAEKLLAQLNADKAKLEAQANAEKARLEAEFNRLLAAGDVNVADQKYPDAIGNFKGALIIKSGNPVATEKLANAEKLLAQLNAENAKKEAEQKFLAEKLKKYKETIVKADQLFESKTYPESKIQYGEAIKLFEMEQYPKDRIAVIDSLLAKQAADRLLAQKMAEEQKKLQGENSYLKNIQTGDANYAKTLWLVAVFYYQEALKFKAGDKIAIGKIEDCQKMIEGNITAEKMLLYTTSVKKADEELQAKKYSSARFYYGQAAAVLPWESYPKGQLILVEKLISSSDVNGTEAKYLEAVKKAEEAVVLKNFAVARFYFQKAITLKPDEEYPKQQLKRLSSE
jgi:tetratricopeptide (TPR) repeat protein